MQDEKFYIEEGRRLARRNFARGAFAFVVIFGSAVTAAILFHPDRLEMATSLDKTSSILNGILTAFVAIIMSYLGASTWEAVSSNKVEHRTTFREPPVPPAPKQSTASKPARPATSDQPDLFPEN